MTRREFPARVKLAAWERAQGKCEHPDCGKKLYPGDIHYDHVIADSIGGEPTLDNCQVLCRAHHAIKTNALDTPRAAKTVRQKIGHIGAKPKHPWPKRSFRQNWSRA